MKDLSTWFHQDLHDALKPASMGFLGKILGWQKEEIEVFIAQIRQDMRNRKKHVYLPVAVVYGRKPEQEQV